MNPWTQILSQLESRIGWQNFSTWLKPTTFSHQEDGTIYVRVANATCKDWIAENYMEQIRTVVRELDLPVKDVLFLYEASRIPSAPEPPALKAEPASRAAPLNPRYRFDTFIVGGSNELAQAAAERVAKDPARSYNPLFLYGG